MTASASRAVPGTHDSKPSPAGVSLPLATVARRTRPLGLTKTGLVADRTRKPLFLRAARYACTG